MTVLIIIGGLLVDGAIALGTDALVVWLTCWGLNAIGIHQIGTWPVHFSLPLVILFAVAYMVLKSIFSTTISKKN